MDMGENPLPGANWPGLSAAAPIAAANAQANERIELLKKVSDLKQKLELAESRLSSREAALDAANAKVDDLAATTVHLQSQLSAILPASAGRKISMDEVVRRLQATDLIQRKTIAHTEARVLQLIKLLQEHEIEIPVEPDLPGWNR